MRGDIYTWKSCACGGVWERIKDPVTKDTLNIICSVCRSAPELFGVDGRSFRNRKGAVGRLTHDKHGSFLYSVHQARRLLEAIRSDWDTLGSSRFDSTKWSTCGRETYKLSECVKEWILYLEEKGRQGKPGGSKGYRSHVNRFFRLHILPCPIGNGKTLGETDVRELTADDIERLSLDLGEKMAQGSVSSGLSYLMTLLKRYRDRKNVLSFIPPFPEGWNENPDIPRRVINVADQRVLICRMLRRFYKGPIRRVALLLLKTHVALGCRPSEVCALKRKDVLDDDRVMIQGSIDAADGTWKEMTKNRRRRISDPLPPELAAALRALRVLPRGFLFEKEDGELFNPNRLTGQFRMVRGPEYPDVTLNTFSRHTLATMVAREARENGIKEAARRLGNTIPIARKNYVQEG